MIYSKISSLLITAALLLTTNQAFNPSTNRRAFLTTSGAILTIPCANAATTTTSPKIYTTPDGIKYAILDKAKKENKPYKGDFCAIEYTGYLTNGSIFDATHSKGKQNALLFQLGSPAVIPGLNEIVQEMSVGDSIQAIIPADKAYGEKGVCVEQEDGTKECLISGGATLVYDIFLKKSSIPPP